MNFEPLSTTNLVTIIGWIASFGLGLLSAYIGYRYAKPRKRLKWGVVSESNLLAREALDQLESGFGVPVKVLINELPQSDLNTIRLRIISDSNLEIQNVKLYFKFGATAIVHVGRYVGDATAYSETLTLTRSENQAALTIAHINPKQEFDVEFLVASYRAGNVSVDMAEPGVTLRNATLLQEESSASRLVLILVGAVITFILLTWLIIKVVVSSEVRRALEADSTSDQVAPLEPDNNSR